MPSIPTKYLPSREERTEIAKRAQAIYEPLREKLEKDRWGEYITINVDNGDYAVAPEHRKAVKIMRAKYPGVLFYTFRIGYRAVFHFRGLGATDGKRPQGFSHDDWENRGRSLSTSFDHCGNFYRKYF